MTQSMDQEPTDHVATILGTWSQGSMPPLTPDDYVEAMELASAYTRQHLVIEPGQHVLFHILYADHPGADVHRTLWRLEVTATGPSLELNTGSDHPSEINLILREYSHTEKRQVIFADDALNKPYRGVLSPCIGAILLRHYFGDAGIDVPIEGFGVGHFTPQRLRFRDTSNWFTLTVPYAADWGQLAGYELIVPESVDLVPALWLAIDEGEPVEWQVSYCVTDGEHGVNNRWDTPHAAPAFTPLDWPPDTPVPPDGFPEPTEPAADDAPTSEPI